MSDTYSFGSSDDDTIGPPTPLKKFRSKYYEELAQKPQVYRKLMALTQAEVGNQGPEAQQAFLETVFNRAASRGQTLDEAMQLVSKGGYYPGLGDYNKVSAETQTGYGDLLNQVRSGSNVGNYATGNASGTVGFNKGPQVAAYGSERFGIEGPDVNTMQGVAGGTIEEIQASTFDPTGRKRMANGDQPGILGALGMQNQQPQGLLGALGDPETMAYLGMMLKGLSPYSNLDPNSMLSSAHTNALRKEQLRQQMAERATDNARADEALGLRRQEYGDARTERQAREAERLGLKREQLDQKERERKANADAMRLLGLPPTPSSPEETPGPQSSYTEPTMPPAYTTPEAPPEQDAAAGPEGQYGRTSAPSRDETLRAQNEKLQQAILGNDKLAPATLNAINKKIEQNEAMMGTPDWVTTPEMAKKYHDSTVAERVGAERSKPARENVYRGTINAANEALQMLEQDTGPISTAMSGIGVSRYAGLPAWAAKKYPGASPASEFGEKLETIKAGTQIDAMLALKQASSTGATGLGSLTEKEGEILQKIQGSLNQERQSVDSLKRNIIRAKNFAEAMKSGITITEENEDKILNKGLEKSESKKGNATQDALKKKYGLE